MEGYYVDKNCAPISEKRYSLPREDDPCRCQMQNFYGGVVYSSSLYAQSILEKRYKDDDNFLFNSYTNKKGEEIQLGDLCPLKREEILPDNKTSKEIKPFMPNKKGKK